MGKEGKIEELKPQKAEEPEIIIGDATREFLEELRKPENRTDDQTFAGAWDKAYDKLSKKEKKDIDYEPVFTEILHYSVEKTNTDDVYKDLMTKLINLRTIRQQELHKIDKKNRYDLKDYDKVTDPIHDRFDKKEEELWQNHLLSLGFKEFLEEIYRWYQDHYKKEAEKNASEYNEEEVKEEFLKEAPNEDYIKRFIEYFCKEKFEKGSHNEFMPRGYSEHERIRVKIIKDLIAEAEKEDIEKARWYSHAIRNVLMPYAFTLMNFHPRPIDKKGYERRKEWIQSLLEEKK